MTLPRNPTEARMAIEDALVFLPASEAIKVIEEAWRKAYGASLYRWPENSAQTPRTAADSAGGDLSPPIHQGSRRALLQEH